MMLTATSLPKRIVVAVDGSDPSFRAVSYALNLARLSKSTMVLAHVLLLPLGATPETLVALRKDLYAKGEEILRRAGDIGRSGTIPTDTRIVETDHSIAKVIVELANEEKADLIVVGTEGTTGYGKLMLGSTAAGTVNLANCPVLVVR